MREAVIAENPATANKRSVNELMVRHWRKMSKKLAVFIN